MQPSLLLLLTLENPGSCGKNLDIDFRAMLEMPVLVRRQLHAQYRAAAELHVRFDVKPVIEDRAHARPEHAFPIRRRARRRGAKDDRVVADEQPNAARIVAPVERARGHGAFALDPYLHGAVIASANLATQQVAV